MSSIHRQISDYLKNNLSSAKYKHTLGTTKVAHTLAVKHNVPIQKAELAALLHDIGRIYTSKKLLLIAKKIKSSIPYYDQIVKYNPALLHSFVSAHIAKTKYKIKDKHIISAISLHTIAGPKMSELEKLIYVADAIAPDRRYPAVNKLKNLANRDLNKAFKFALLNKLSYVLKKQKWIHPNAILAWNEIL